MKEIIYHVVASTPGRVISIAVDEVLTKDNILGIINKTTGKVLYTPLKYPKLTFGLSAGTMTLTLASSIPSISVGDHLLIKVYTDDDGYAKEATLGASQDTSVSTTIFGWLKSIRDFLVGIVTTNPYAKDSTVAKEEQATLNKVAIMGGVDYEVDRLPTAMYEATQSLYGCAVGDDDYTLMEECAPTEECEVALGKLFKVTEENSGDYEYGLLAAPKTVDASQLSLYDSGGVNELHGVTEWIVFEKDKTYIVTGMYAGVADSYDNTYTIFTFAEHALGRSVKEVYDKVDNISPEDPYSQALAEFFGLPDALPGSYQALTSAEAIAIARDCQYNVMGTSWPIPTWLPTGVTEAQVESAAEGLGIPYHEPTQTA